MKDRMRREGSLFGNRRVWRGAKQFWFLRTLCDDLRCPELIMDIEVCSLEVLWLSYQVCSSYWASSASESAVSYHRRATFGAGE
jgi:hypothetical protein